MAFENLSDKLQGVFKKLRGKGVLTEKDLKEVVADSGKAVYYDGSYVITMDERLRNGI